ncbi:unnamed protein product, partial [Prorocentrum cordatum]
DLFIAGQPGTKPGKEYVKDARGFTMRRYTASSDLLDDLPADRRLHWIFNRSFAVDTTDFPELCDASIVEDTCKLFNGDPEELANADRIVPSDVQGVLSATVEGIADLWEAVGLPIPAKCMDLCHAVVSWLEQHAHVVPPKSDLGCSQNEKTGKHDCDIDLSPPSVHDSGGSSEEELPIFDHDELDENNQDIPPERLDDDEEDEGEADGEDGVEYAMDEIAVEIAHMFRIYPEIVTAVEIEEDLLDDEDRAEDKNLRGSPETGRRLTWDAYGGGGYGGSFRDKIRITEQKAIAYISSAVREFNRRNTRRHMDKWFGRRAFNDPSSRNRVQQVLNSVNRMLSHVEYVYPGPQCSPNTYAYVYPEAYTCGSSAEYKRDACTKTRGGKFVFYMCQLTMRSPMSVQIETLTHEGSHHATAYTDDVCMDYSNPCRQTAYGRSPCQQLASMNPTKALKNADNYCYYINDITDVGR